MHKFFTVAREDHGESPGQKRSEKGLHARPLLCNGPPRILDLGCGTGIWCNDMAEYGHSLPRLQPHCTNY